ncbi:MAG: hypothetical protein QN198_10850 [Armatimonadota bacterium]|nr:hypothetical protein [Armatimonadota bacterium]MDR5704082.1 hypothetical protein [Armatimonadota bacterium]
MKEQEGKTIAQQAEEIIRRLKGVEAVRVEAGEEGGIHLIHVLGRPERSPKMIALDVVSALAAELGVTLEPRQIRIALLRQEEQQVLPPGRARLKFVGLTVSTIRNTLEVKVHLEDRGLLYEGVASGPNSSRHRLELAAQATLRAVETFLRAEGLFLLEEVAIVPLARKEVALALVTLLSPEEEHLSGSAIVREDPREAVVRAVLAAINRPLSWLAAQG